MANARTAARASRADGPTLLAAVLALESRIERCRRDLFDLLGLGHRLEGVLRRMAGGTGARSRRVLRVLVAAFGARFVRVGRIGDVLEPPVDEKMRGRISKQLL